ncbi:MAG: molybdopterin-dependent oxidoreductase [Streptomycetales bacterium]
MVAEGLDAVHLRRPIPLAKALSADTIIAYAMNGEELPADHGFPARLFVPGWVGVASVKWLGRLVVAERPVRTPWNTESYVLTGGVHGPSRSPLHTHAMKSALELPWPARLARGEHRLTGRSWSPYGSITRVQYSLDDARSWQEAEIVTNGGRHAWTRWALEIGLPPGPHILLVKATDKAGHSQPARTPSNSLGYLYDAVLAHPIKVQVP